MYKRQPRDILLLCSDGLSNCVSVPQIEETLARTPFYEAADALVQKALEGGGLDNITVLLLSLIHILEQMFPAARVLRMDLDTTSRKNAHETMLRRFAKGEYDIMLGTQMVAKGLDFEKVTLVGVLGIDQLLFAQGYKAFENVFSLVTQVVGRGGRAAQAGRALIQTVDPNHPVLNLAARQDYKSFFAEELSLIHISLVQLKNEHVL